VQEVPTPVPKDDEVLIRCTRTSTILVWTGLLVAHSQGEVWPVAFNLDSNESVGRGLHRVVRKQVERAVEDLSHASAESIHDARKSLKKARAVLDLIGEDRRAGAAQRIVRRAGRTLSPLRDGAAVIESAKTLCQRKRWALSGEECSALSAGLTNEKKQSEQVADIPRIRKKVSKDLGRAAKSIDRMKWKRVKFADVSDMLRRGYRDARRNMRRARKTGRADDFHSWRKSVKTLWYGLRLLKQQLRLERELKQLRTLETLLGDDHDLVVLDLAVNRNRTSGAIEELASRLTRLSKERQSELRRKALAQGARTFRRRPKPFERHLKRLWSV
jgi:CHAD domain-containing protein